MPDQVRHDISANELIVSFPPLADNSPLRRESRKPRVLFTSRIALIKFSFLNLLILKGGIERSNVLRDWK